MAGSSMVFAYDNGHDWRGKSSSVKTVTIDWVSDDTTGAVSGTTAKIVGELLKAVTDPGTAAPTASYDITLSDADGGNLLANCFDDLADRHTSNTETVDFFLTDGAVGVGLRPIVCSTVAVAVANAGNSKAGRLVLYYR